MQFTIDDILVKRINPNQLASEESDALKEIMSDFSGSYNMLGFFPAIAISILSVVWPDKILETYVEHYNQKCITAQRITGKIPINDWFILSDAKTNKYIGRLTLSTFAEYIDGILLDNMIEIAIFLCPEYRNKGLVQRFHKRVLHILKQKCGYDFFTFCFRTRIDNDITLHIASKMETKRVAQIGEEAVFVFEG